MELVIGIFVSMIDPIALVGYLVAGIAIKQYPFAILAALVWRGLLQIVVSHSLNGQASMVLFVYSILGAIIATSLIFAIAKIVRNKKVQRNP